LFLKSVFIIYCNIARRKFKKTYWRRKFIFIRD